MRHSTANFERSRERRYNVPNHHNSIGGGGGGGVCTILSSDRTKKEKNGERDQK